MAVAKRTATKRGSKAKGNELPEEHTASEAVAHAISTEFGDLTPSVKRIMESDLGEPGKLEAITLFRDSLGATDDPNRNPAHAIESGRRKDG